MKETIYKILESKVKLLTYTSREEYTKEAAKEISEMVYEFIEQVSFEPIDFFKSSSDKTWIKADNERWPDSFTMEQMFNYWLTNIKR